MSIDENLETTATLTDEEICSQVIQSEEEPSDTEDDIDDDPILSAPSHKEMLDALRVLNRGFQCYGDNFDLHYSYEKCAHNIIESSKTQSRIEDFFRK